MLAYEGNVLLQIEQDFSNGWPSIGLCVLIVRFGTELLFDIASSVSVWVFWTCLTHSAGVTKNLNLNWERFF